MYETDEEELFLSERPYRKSNVLLLNRKTKKKEDTHDSSLKKAMEELKKV